MTKPTDAEKSRVLAERLMGWHFVTFGGCKMYKDKHNQLGEYVSRWNPFTSWDQMGMVIEEMKRRGWTACRLFINDTYTVCYFIKPYFRAYGKAKVEGPPKEAVPRAVSTAAYKALEGGKG